MSEPRFNPDDALPPAPRRNQSSDDMLSGEKPEEGVWSRHETSSDAEAPSAPVITSTGARWTRGADLAEVLGISKKTVEKRAIAEGWQKRQSGNRFEFLVPEELAPQASPEPAKEGSAHVKFTDLTNAKARATVLLRQRAVLAVETMGGNRSQQRAAVVALFVMKHEGFAISLRSLERWEHDYRIAGVDGLVDQKLGNVGRKGVEVPEDLRRIGQAMALEKGSVAAAARELSARNDLPASLRRTLHGAHASKSHVNPSVRKALSTSPLTQSLAQGPRAARLAGRWTPGNYESLAAGQMFVSDDMTSNVICWVEDLSNKWGYRIGQAQVLPVMDIGSLRWLNVRVIMREGSQYSSDDIWGLFGDVFDTFGLPAIGFLLEGGHWQAKRVQGHRTGLTNEERIGGLESLGLESHRSFDPRSKGMLEGAFNTLQRHMDACPGWAGRDQRKEMPELLKKQLAACRAGKHHPREFFPHISQLANHITTVMENLNNERQDGKILRGMSPLEKWAADAPRLAMLPDSAKWLYRSAMNICPVTANGVRIEQGSGRHKKVFYYDNPALLQPRQGTKVTVYWNEANPNQDAAVTTVEEHPKFLGMVTLVPELNRFSATPQQLETEAKRKAEGMAFARTELRAIQPHLQRKATPASIGGEMIEATGPALAEAAREFTAKVETRQRMRKVAVSDQDRADMLPDPVAAPIREQSGMDEFTQLFADEAASSNSAPLDLSTI